MSRLLYRIGHAAGAHPWRVLVSWVLVAVSILMLSSSLGGEPDETFRLPGAESQHAADLLADQFPGQTLYTSNVVFHDADGLTQGATQAAVQQAVEDLGNGAHVVSVSNPYDPRGPTVSEDGTTAIATVGFDVEETTSAMYDEAQQATNVAGVAGIQVEYDGGLGYAEAATGGSGEVIGLVVAIVVLAVAFGSIVAMGVPIAVALFAILIGSSTLTILAGFVSVPDIANIVGLMLGLGVGIDYALFILSRHRQNLAAGMDVPEAIGLANATAGLSVLFAGATVILALVGVQVSGIPMLAMMGWGAAIMVAVTVLAAITLLPAVLGLFGRRINSLRIPLVRRPASVTAGSWSARWVARVIEHPVAHGAVAVVVLVLLAIPAVSMRLGFADSGNDPTSMTTRRAYDLVADGYGPGTNGPLTVVLESQNKPLQKDVATAAAHAASDTSGVASVTTPLFNADRDLAVFTVTPTTAPQDEQTSELIAGLRADTFPQALDGDAAEAYVTGGTALADDVSSQLQSRMPLFLGAVIGLSFVILMIVFRSVWVPLKAAILNLLGVAASYGVVVAIFQWGWGAPLIGVHETIPIMPLAPMLMFAILFGLSMDYEVFLLSRVREQFGQHGDAQRAVVEGIGATGRVITSAALIMIAIFGSFVLDADPTTKIFGVGLGIAVLLDVTLIRMMLVPAVMSLLGARAWWLPSWLDRTLPQIDREGGTGKGQQMPVPEDVPASPAYSQT